LKHLSSNDAEDRLRHALAHVLWIGGSPAAGKTTIVRLLARRYNVDVYDFDDHEQDHVERRIDNATAYPVFTPFRALTTEQRWLLRSVDDITDGVIALWTERFRLVVDDLLALPDTSPLIVEGAGLFPDCVRPVVGDAHQALWLIPSPAFCRRVRLERDAGAFADTSDPAQALDNLIARDVLLAAYVQRRAVDLGLKVVEVDGATPLDKMVAVVVQHVGLERLTEKRTRSS